MKCALPNYINIFVCCVLTFKKALVSTKINNFIARPTPDIDAFTKFAAFW